MLRADGADNYAKCQWGSIESSTLMRSVVGGLMMEYILGTCVCVCACLCVWGGGGGKSVCLYEKECVFSHVFMSRIIVCVCVCVHELTHVCVCDL